MDTQNNTYKYLSIVLAIIAIIFAVLYFTKPSEPVTDTFNDISASVEECKMKVETWQRLNGGKPTTTAEATAELQTILAECKEIFQDTDDKI